MLLNSDLILPIYSLEETSLLSVLRTSFRDWLSFSLWQSLFLTPGMFFTSPSYYALSMSFTPRITLVANLQNVILVSPGECYLLYLRRLQDFLENCRFLSFMFSDLGTCIVFCSSRSWATPTQEPGNTNKYGLNCDPLLPHSYIEVLTSRSSVCAFIWK